MTTIPVLRSNTGLVIRLPCQITKVEPDCTGPGI